MNQGAVQTAKKRSGCGCFGLGCLVATVISLVVAGGISWFLVHNIRGAVKEYTTDSSTPIPIAEVDEVTRQAALEKLSDLREVLRSAGGQGSFSFTGSELQALASDATFGGKVALDAKGDALSILFSFALSDFNNPAFDLLLTKELAGRFFNGSAVASLGVANNSLQVRFRELSLNGNAIGGEALEQAGGFVQGAIESFILSLAGDSDEARDVQKGGSGRITGASVTDGTLRLDIGPLKK